MVQEGSATEGSVTLTGRQIRFGIWLLTRLARDPLYRRRRFPADVIAHAVELYVRFPLSLRMVEDVLEARGVIVSHQTVRLWAEKFGRHFAKEIRKRSIGRLGDKWLLVIARIMIHSSISKRCALTAKRCFRSIP